MAAEQPSLTRYAWISIFAALATIGLKGGAYAITGSVGLLSDAFESLVNLASAVVALYALKVAARPADEEHAYGHTKAEYFSSGFEGALILAAALGIAWTAGARLLDPRPLQDVGLGPGHLRWPRRPSTSWWPASSSGPASATARSLSRPTPTTS